MGRRDPARAQWRRARPTRAPSRLSHSGNADLGEFEDAVIPETSGAVPEDFRADEVA